MESVDVRTCKEQAAFYRCRGFNPLPSREDEKRPVIKYADMWAACLLPSEFDRHATACVQVMTGRAWGLLVIDLDGPEAIERWATMGRHPRTWISHSGGGGRHVWFGIPTHGRPLPKAVLWKGDGHHSAIERLCDKSLVMAPPSIHPKTGRRYLWLDRPNSPYGVGKPAACPAWVLNLAPVQETPVRPAYVPRRDSGPRTSWRETVASLDVLGLARAWGLRTVGQPRSSGWQPCHAYGREDQHPSAAIHIESGYYVDRGSGERMGFLDLAVAMRAYATPQDAIKDLGGRYGRCG